VAAGALLALLVLVALRRWVHHAQLELAPVIVPPSADAAAVLSPPPAAVFARMRLDLRSLFAPPRRPKLAVLTFDDGPYPVTTPALLQVLRRLRAPADFFLVGRDAAQQPDITSRSAAWGVEIGNHTLTHPQMPSLLFAAQLEEIVDGAKAIRAVTGKPVRYFRPPHGNMNALTILAARAAAQTLVLWDVDPGDWRTLPADAIVDHVLTHARAPAIILLHNGKEATIAALPAIVSAYRQAGFKFVTLTQLQHAVALPQINDPSHISLERSAVK
jgi:peptidoglycan/xylan/chitin deacetylase (PgdA/CDA1 family)